MTRASASPRPVSSLGISSPRTPAPSTPTGASSEVGVKHPSADRASTTSSSATPRGGGGDAPVGGRAPPPPPPGAPGGAPSLGAWGGAAEPVGQLALGLAHLG